MIKDKDFDKALLRTFADAKAHFKSDGWPLSYRCLLDDVYSQLLPRDYSLRLAIMFQMNGYKLVFDKAKNEMFVHKRKRKAAKKRA